MNQRTVSLKNCNEELQQFAYVASHDMREPLRKIQNFADLTKIDLGERLAEDGRYYLDRVQSSAARMSKILEDLLTFSRIQARQNPFEWTSVQAIMEEVLSDLELQIEQTHAIVECSGDVPLKADGESAAPVTQSSRHERY